MRRHSTTTTAADTCGLTTFRCGDGPSKAQTSMHRIVNKSAPLLLLSLVLLTLALAACSQIPTSSGAQAGAAANEVDMGASSFAQTSVTINAGESVHF